MASNSIGTGSDGDGGGRPDPISLSEIQRTRFELTHVNLEHTAAQLRIGLLQGQDTSRLTSLLFDWLREVRGCLPPDSFDEHYHRLRRVLLDAELAGGDKAYELRISLERLFADLRTYAEFPVPRISWDIAVEPPEQPLAISRQGTRRDFLGKVASLLSLLASALIGHRRLEGAPKTTER